MSLMLAELNGFRLDFNSFSKKFFPWTSAHYFRARILTDYDVSKHR
jgi:hypothetical protein